MAYILERFGQNVADAPNAPFMYDDAHRSGVTFSEFDELSGRFYGWLKRRGVGRESMVMIRLPRGVMPLIAAVGVWKAGAAFVIVEEDYAPERIAFIREDCGCACELNQDTLDEILATPALPGYEKTEPHDAAFAVYTSGTTGNPKGVLHEYGNIERCVRSLQIEGNVMLRAGIFRPYTSPQSFVAAVIGLTAMLAADHARMYIVSYETAKNPDALLRLFKEYRFNMLFLSPSYARLLAPRLQKYLRVLVIGSEPANGLYFPGMDVRNFYASSESYFLPATFRLDRAYDPAPVGKPAFDLDLRLVDEEGREVPDGEMGEIIFDATWLRGYIHRPEENARAIRDGYYHTGDLARLDEQGNLVILGRANDMVKINGNRVEPAEIEGVVKRLLGIDWAAARAFVEDAGKGYICVYYTADIRFDADELRKRLAEYLPYYMIPSYFIHVDTIPLRPNGKLDRRALPAPRAEDFRRNYVAPADETQAALCRGFEAVLGVKRVSALDDFYELGGDSLHSIQLVMECDLPGLSAGDIFRGRTPQGIAAIYLEARREAGQVSLNEQNAQAIQRPHPLTTEQQYMFDVQLYTPKSTMYNLFSMLKAEPGVLEPARAAEAVGRAIQGHPSLLTTLYFDDAGNIMQRYAPEVFEPIAVERCTEAQFQAVKDTLVQPFKLIGERLYRARMFETEKGLYLFLDIHHMMFDGTSYRTLLRDIAAVYFGEAPKPDYYYAMLANRERERNSDFYRQSKRYFERLYGGGKGQWATYPRVDHHSRENRPGRVALPLGIAAEKCLQAERRYRVSRNELFIGAAVLAVAAYNDARDVKLSWIYNGRDDESLMTTTGLLFRDLPMAIRLGEATDLDALYNQVHEQVRGGIEHSCYPYVEAGFAKDTDLTACVLYQRSIYDPIQKGGVTLTPIEVRQNQAASQTILDIQIIEGVTGIELVLDYIATIYEPESMERFARLMIRIVERIVAAATEGGSGDIGALIDRAL